MQTFWIILVSVLVVILMGSYYFARIAIFPRTYSYDEVYKSKVASNEINPSEWESWEKEEIDIPSSYGYQLHGFWLPVPDASGTVVLAHGITVNVFASLEYVKLFRTRRFNILMYDHRNHGKSGGKVTTFGYYEKHDLKAVVDWVEAKTGTGRVIGTHGESMGAAIALQHAAIDDRLSFVVADCAYADLVKLFRYRIRADYHIPGWILLPFGSLFSKIMSGFAFSQVKPVNGVKKIETPVFFIHGEKDNYIPPWHVQALYDAKQIGIRKIWIAPKAGHAESQVSDPVAYDKKIGEFLGDIFDK